MKYSEDLESRPRRDPNIEINVQPPSSTWSGVAYNPSYGSQPSPRAATAPAPNPSAYDRGTDFEFDFRGDSRFKRRTGSSTPDDRPYASDARIPPSDGGMTPTYPARP